MATDKKSQHVGNHGGRYTDIDGMTKQFTYIDHDRHTTRLTSGREYVEKIEKLTPEQELVSDILSSGMNCDAEFIRLYDEELAKKYGFERFRKGFVQNIHHTSEGFYKDLEDIFKRALKAEKNKYQSLISKKYDLQRKFNKEDI